ncbi:MAG: AAA family ATPase [Planctomycetaceae bacterium]|nr:AAA family ATPase [Planctomycetaceae bacterium]
MNKLTPVEYLAQLHAGRANSHESVESVLDSLDFMSFPGSVAATTPEHLQNASDAAQRVHGELSPPQAAAGKNGNSSPAATCGDPSEAVAARGPGEKNDSYLAELFDRVNSLLGDQSGEEAAFVPRAPATLEEAGLTEDDLERLILKFLLTKGASSGRRICQQVKLGFGIVEPLLKQWKYEQLLELRNSAEIGDYVYAITDLGRERAKRYSEECTYFGAAPVQLRDYLIAMERQSIAKQSVREEELKKAFADLLIAPTMLDKLGPAINSGRGMFLFGEPGNGKTSIAERVTACFGSTIWIPRALGIDGDIMRLFDPGVHELVEDQREDGLFDLSGVDQRWVRIVRPTVIAGGELTMSELEVTQNMLTHICESPLQLKSNCGTLVIDDFGRQTMPVDQLLNRWIVPLEKRYDFLNMPSGKKIQVPFDQLIIFSTNLEPKDLVDGAFLRRIPYKIEVPDPTREHFVKLFEIMAPKFGMTFESSAVDYLIQTHYERVNRPFRACQPRDLLLQVRNYCVYKQIPKKMSPAAFDFAVENYFSVM